MAKRDSEKKELPQGFRWKKNGRIEYRFMIGSERFSVSGPTVTECRKKEREKRDKVAAGQYIRNEKITVRQYFDEWMKNRAGTVKESTINTEKSEFSAVLDLIGGERVAKLERRQIIELQRKLRERYSTTGVNYRIALLSTLLKIAVYDEIITKNPCEGVPRLKRAEKQAREASHRALTQEEQEAFFRASAENNEWLHELLCFLIQTGTRIGEALALKWSDIDHKSGVIHIRRTIIDTEAGPQIGSTTKSRAGIRDIPITEEIREVLRRQRQKVRELFGEKVTQIDGLVFVSMKGHGMLRKSSVNVSIYRIAKRAGIDRISAHAFRDTFATRAIESGMNPQTLKAILGHTSFEMTMDLYAHVLPNTKQKEMDMLKIVT